MFAFETASSYHLIRTTMLPPIFPFVMLSLVLSFSTPIPSESLDER